MRDRSAPGWYVGPLDLPTSRYGKPAFEERPRPCKVALCSKQGASLWMVNAVLICSGPNAFSWIATARSKSGCAPVKSPSFWSRRATSLRLSAVS